MGTKTPQELLRDWNLEKISTEQAVGHILQNLILLQKEQQSLSSALYEIIRQLDTHTNRSEK